MYLFYIDVTKCVCVCVNYMIFDNYMYIYRMSIVPQRFNVFFTFFGSTWSPATLQKKKKGPDFSAE